MKAIVLALFALAILAAPVCGCTGAVAMGMGWAGLAITDGPNAVYWAPEFLNEIQPSFCMTFSPIGSFDSYGQTICAIIPIQDHNFGFGYAQYYDNYFLMLAAPLLDGNNFKIGGHIKFDPIFGPSYAVNTSLIVGPIVITYRYDGTQRYAVAWIGDNFKIVYEKYLSHGPGGYGYYANQNRYGVEITLGIISFRAGLYINLNTNVLLPACGIGINLKKLKLDYGICGKTKRIEISVFW